jgi:hypothetical protein
VRVVPNPNPLSDGWNGASSNPNAVTLTRRPHREIEQHSEGVDGAAGVHLCADAVENERMRSVYVALTPSRRAVHQTLQQHSSRQSMKEREKVSEPV